ncbi:Putative salt-induced outer membrane protein YdiY [Rubritalea squalenifaciens DSM 18772]|uniref:Putative salt-induced outer membrane protein YdiY n=1 Tax=Rubritalea squalenifaciens DSM 18772 TaxID=1123071 RepID=A0A1M6NS66_9BACT|nr:DUF481 domain-containing protein [Rubritalea squalenifaciens]SHJ98490.1 Putative salt-induced outer membrane protein YdiY [Rubritalea squalenifaciens DSM 18772]
MRALYLSATSLCLSCGPLLAAEKSWTHDGDFGISLSSGNSDTLRFSLGLDSSYEFELCELRNEFDAIYGEDEGVKSHESITNTFTASRDFRNSPWYAAISNDFLYDPMAGIDYRNGTNLLLGYHFIDNERFKFRVEVGPGVIFEKRDGDSSSYAAFKAAQYFSWQINEGTRLFQSLKMTGELGDFSNSIYTAEAGVESALYGPWSVRLAAKSIHYGETDSKSDDQLIILGLGYSFDPDGKGIKNLNSKHKNKGFDSDNWIITGLIGGSYASGNTNSKSLATGILAKRKTEFAETSLGLSANFSQTEGETTAQTAGLDAHSQYSFDKPWFAGVRLDVDHDDLADLDYRIALTPYLGRYLFENDKDFASLEIGPSVVYEKQEDETNTYFAPYISFKADKHFTEDTRLFARVSWRGEAKDPSNYILTSKIGLDHALNHSVSLKAVLTDTYDNTPAEGRDSNDILFITGLEFKL